MDKFCAIYRTLDFVGKKWTLLIMLELYKSGGSKRYTQIKRKIGDITPKMLSSRLKELERRKLVRRNVNPASYPVSWEYSLTPRGVDFMKVLNEIKKWSHRWDVKSSVKCKNTPCEHCGL